MILIKSFADSSLQLFDIFFRVLCITGNFIMMQEDKYQALKEVFSTRHEPSRSNLKYLTELREQTAWFFFSEGNQDQRILMVFGNDSEADGENSEL